MNALPRWQAFRAHGCKCAPATLTDDARSDPTDTGSLRAAFVRDLSARWALLRRLVQDAAPVISGTNSPPSVANWLGIDRAGPFASWFEGVLERTVLEHDGAWMQPYLEKAVRQADKRAEKLGGMALGSSGFASQLSTLQSVAVSELKGICAAVLQQSTREAATLALAAKSPDAIARAILGRIDALGQSRSEQMAEYLVIKTFSLATLASFKAAGHKYVGTIPEAKQPVPTAAAGKPVAAASSVVPIRSTPPKPVAPSVPTETPEQTTKPETTSRGKEAAVALGLAALAGLSGGVLSKPMPKWQAAVQRRARGAGTSSEAPHVAELEQMAKEGTVPPAAGEILPPLPSARTEPERPEPPVIEGERLSELPALPWGQAEAATMVNIVTAGDDRVCAICLAAAAASPYDIDTAAGLVPFHPQCRCAYYPVTKDKVGDAAKSTLYVRRDVLNAAEIVAWAKARGFKTTLPAGDMHVTVAFSRAPVDWSRLTPVTSDVSVVAGARSMKQFGDAVVLTLESGALSARHDEIGAIGASWDFPEYRPHVTITYDAGDVDIGDVTPFAGQIILGPEVFAPVNEDWKSNVVEDGPKAA